MIDPPELFASLENEPVPWGVPSYFQRTRARIAGGETLVSKVDGGLPVTDTYPDDVHSEYTPAPATPDFLLAVKNVGQGAIESIIASREAEGRFRTLGDLCRRIDLRLANRKVLETFLRYHHEQGLSKRLLTPDELFARETLASFKV